MTRDEKLLKAVARAWNVVGANPHYHHEQQKRLIRDWPVLAEAVQAVALSEKHSSRAVQR